MAKQETFGLPRLHTNPVADFEVDCGRLPSCIERIAPRFDGMFDSDVDDVEVFLWYDMAFVLT